MPSNSSSHRATPPLELLCRQLRGLFKLKKTKEAAPKSIRILPATIEKVEKELNRLRNEHRLVSTPVIVELISTLESQPAVFNRLDSAGVGILLAVLLQAEFSVEKEHCILFITTSLCDEARDPILPTPTEDKKIALCQKLLQPLLDCFVDHNQSYKIRRWVGVLLRVLVDGIDECKAIFESLTLTYCQNREKLGSMLFAEPNEILRIICSRLLKAADLDAKKVFPTAIDNELIREFPKSSQPSMSWDNRFQIWMDSVFSKVPGMKAGELFFVSTVSTNSSVVFAQKQAVSILIESDIATIYEPGSDGLLGTLLEIPTKSISSIETLEAFSQPGDITKFFSFIVTLKQTNLTNCFHNAKAIAVETFELTTFEEETAVSLYSRLKELSVSNPTGSGACTPVLVNNRSQGQILPPRSKHHALSQELLTNADVASSPTQEREYFQADATQRQSNSVKASSAHVNSAEIATSKQAICHPDDACGGSTEPKPASLIVTERNSNTKQDSKIPKRISDYAPTSSPDPVNVAADDSYSSHYTRPSAEESPNGLSSSLNFSRGEFEIRMVEREEENIYDVSPQALRNPRAAHDIVSFTPLHGKEARNHPHSANNQTQQKSFKNIASTLPSVRSALEAEEGPRRMTYSASSGRILRLGSDLNDNANQVFAPLMSTDELEPSATKHTDEYSLDGGIKEVMKRTSDVEMERTVANNAAKTTYKGSLTKKYGRKGMVASLKAKKPILPTPKSDATRVEPVSEELPASQKATFATSKSKVTKSKLLRPGKPGESFSCEDKNVESPLKSLEFTGAIASNIKKGLKPKTTIGLRSSDTNEEVLSKSTMRQTPAQQTKDNPAKSIKRSTSSSDLDNDELQQDAENQLFHDTTQRPDVRPLGLLNDTAPKSLAIVNVEHESPARNYPHQKISNRLAEKLLSIFEDMDDVSKPDKSSTGPQRLPLLIDSPLANFSPDQSSKSPDGSHHTILDRVNLLEPATNSQDHQPVLSLHELHSRSASKTPGLGSNVETAVELQATKRKGQEHGEDVDPVLKKQKMHAQFLNAREPSQSPRRSSHLGAGNASSSRTCNQKLLHLHMQTQSSLNIQDIPKSTSFNTSEAIEKSAAGDTVPEVALVDEYSARKPKLIGFDAKGPRNQGRSSSSRKSPPLNNTARVLDRMITPSNITELQPLETRKRGFEESTENVDPANDHSPHWKIPIAKREKRLHRCVEDEIFNASLTSSPPEPMQAFGSQGSRVNANGSPLASTSNSEQRESFQKIAGKVMRGDLDLESGVQAGIDNEQTMRFGEDYVPDSVTWEPITALIKPIQSAGDEEQTKVLIVAEKVKKVKGDKGVKVDDPPVPPRLCKNSQTGMIVQNLPAQNASNLEMRKFMNRRKAPSQYAVQCNRASTNLRTEAVLGPIEDPEKTLVNVENEMQETELDFLSEESAMSTNDSDDEEGSSISQDGDYQFTIEEQWQKALRPHQRGIVEILHQITDDMVRHLIHHEEAIEDVVQEYQQKGSKLIEHTLTTLKETRQQAHYEMNSRIKELTNEYRRCRSGVQSTREELKAAPVTGLEKELIRHGDMARKMIGEGRKAVQG